MMMMNLVSLEIDHDSAESTLSNSPESDLMIGDAESTMDECVNWTNEKHKSYLHSLENSFVRQLHSLLGGQTRRFSNSRKSTSQLRVVRNTCLHKVNKRAHHLGTSSLEFRFQKNSSCNKLAKISGNYNMGCDLLCKEEIENSGDKAYNTRNPVRPFVRHEYAAQFAAEAEGSDFREEEENESVSEVTTKRKREANFDDSSLNDQVVP